jgi:hypothetical protein
LKHKATKQEAFEEANRLKNQFRSLNEDEVEFLDSVLETTRAEEERVKRETAEGLEQFRRQQEEADGKVGISSDGAIDAAEGSPTLEEAWVAGGRKRKRVKEKEVLKGLKILRSSRTEKMVDSSTTEAPSSNRSLPAGKPANETKYTEPLQASQDPKARTKRSLGLVDYKSDDDG